MNSRIRKKQQKNINILEDTKKKTLKQKLSNMNKKWLLVVVNVIVLVGVIVFVKVSYAYLYQTLRGQKSYSLKVKGFSLKLDDSSTSENIKIENSIPVSDSEGKQSNAYTFSIINEDTLDTGYVLYLDDVSIDNEINRMKDTVVKYQLIENGKETVGLVSDLGTNPFRILASGVIGGNQTNNYSLRFWIKDDADIPAGQVFNVKIRVIATSKEAIIEGKLVFGETVVTSDSGVTSMTSDELQTYVDRSLNRVLLERYPIGSIYLSTTNQNPSETFGGTWERYATGKTLVGVDETNTNLNTAEKTGGNKNGKITLTTDQLPIHNHAYTPTGSIKSIFTGTEVTTTTKELIGGFGMAANWAANGADFTGFTAYGIVKNTSNDQQRVVLNAGTYNVISSGNPPTGIQINASHSHTVTAAGTVASTFTGTKTTTENTGSGAEISTQDPYITVYMWKRIS